MLGHNLILLDFNLIMPIISVEEPHSFDAALAPLKNAGAAPASTLMYKNPTFIETFFTNYSVHD
jgi:hypothetical protein